MLPVLKRELGDLSYIGHGKFGTVYRTMYKMRRDQTGLVYKEFKYLSAQQGRAKPGDAAQKAISFWESRRGLDRAELDTYFAWPREIVIDEATGEICGFLMPMADRDFFWDTGVHENKPRSLDWLAVPESMLQANHMDLSDVNEPDRLFLMMQLAFAIAWLHRRGWVLGDLSFANAAFALRPPRLILFDCDEATELTDPDRGYQPHTPNWQPPECQVAQPTPQDFATDVYKLGLAIVRCIKAEAGATTTYDVDRLTGILDDDGIELLKRALSKDRDERPLAREIFFHLEQITKPLIEPPTIDGAELIIPLVPRGTDAQVTWQMKHADTIEIFIGNSTTQPVHTVERADHPAGCAFPVPRPGQVTVVATNRYGTAARVIGDVALFEVPSFAAYLSVLPRPDIAPVPDFHSEPLPRLPGTEPGAPGITSIPQPEIMDVLRDIAPGGTITSPGAHINTVLDGSRDLMDAIQAETERFSAGLRRKKKLGKR